MKQKKEEFQYRVGDVYDEQVHSLPVQERMDVLEGICYQAKDESYLKKLSEEELIQKKEILSEVSIQLSELEEKKKLILAELKAEAETQIEIKKEVLVAIKHKSEFCKGILYYIDDQESGMMYIFDENAVCVESRRLRQEEKQTTIKLAKKIG
jgi:hypothetical protein